MKIAFPTMDTNGLDAILADHFGRAPAFVIIDINSEQVQTIPNNSNHFGGTASPPEFLKNQGITALVCKGLGRKAIDLFQQLGIQVYMTREYKVQEAFSSFKEQNLKEASKDDGCKGHD